MAKYRIQVMIMPPGYNDLYRVQRRVCLLWFVAFDPRTKKKGEFFHFREAEDFITELKRFEGWVTIKEVD